MLDVKHVLKGGQGVAERVCDRVLNGEKHYIVEREGGFLKAGREIFL
jgi:hypothetical protein